MKKIRVRYAPSPTGMLHIGGARSALFNYLFAKKNDGEFLLRIEDTDVERNVANGEDSQIDGLAWLGIIADESPRNPNPLIKNYRQSERLERYNVIAKELISKKAAYYCFCSAEELEADREAQLNSGIASPRYRGGCDKLSSEEITRRLNQNTPYCIRLKMKENHLLKFNDLIRGEVSFASEDVGDYVIVKSNNIPTYNFAVVVDDYDMKISHVLRGEEHLSNTPKQIQIFEYMNWPQPEYGHMTLITNEQGKKLSKRDPSIIQFISQYEDMGYLPEAIFNFILLLGFSPGSEQEIFSHEEAINIFSLNRLSKSPSMFDKKKLEWLGKEYIKMLKEEDLISLVYPFLTSAYPEDRTKMIEIIKLFKDNLSCGHDIIELSAVFFNKPIVDWSQYVDFDLKSAKVLILAMIEKLKTSLEVKDHLKQLQLELGIKGPQLYKPLRIALTAQEHGVDLVSIIKILGADESIDRLHAAVAKL